MQAALAVRTKILRVAAEHFECAEDDLVLADGKVAIAGVPGRSIALGELAVQANPMRGAVAPGTEPGLEATSYFGPESGATASGVHAMIVEVDAGDDDPDDPEVRRGARLRHGRSTR